MNKIRILILLCIVLSGWSISSAVSINKQVGAGADCEGCIVFPLAASVRCEPPETCARFMAPDWSNENRFYGSDSTNCRISNDKGDTWSNCGANPSATFYYSYAVTRNGTVLATGNDGGGLVTRIRRSTDGANSWNTVYDSAPIDSTVASAGTGRLRCAQDADLCTVVGRDAANVVWYLVSIDDGLTWALTSLVSVNTSTMGTLSVDNSYARGIWMGGGGGGGATNTAVVWNGGSWVYSAAWPTTAGGQCNWMYQIAGNSFAICHETTVGALYSVRNSSGVSQSTFTLPNVSSDNGGSFGLAISIVPNWISMIRGDEAGSTGVWVSLDSGASFTKLTTVNPAGLGISTQGSIFKGVDNCMYASWLAAASPQGTVIRVC